MWKMSSSFLFLSHHSIYASFSLQGHPFHSHIGAVRKEFLIKIDVACLVSSGRGDNKQMRYSTTEFSNSLRDRMDGRRRINLPDLLNMPRNISRTLAV